jgi:hypothetical protein
LSDVKAVWRKLHRIEQRTLEDHPTSAFCGGCHESVHRRQREEDGDVAQLKR